MNLIMDKENVRIIFVLSKEYDSEFEVSTEMQQAYEACKQNAINVKWYPEQDCLDVELNKTDFMVFQSFEGDTFEKARKTKSVRIVGPWCLLTCLTEGRQIPNFPWPIYSVAMSGCTITTSSFAKPERRNLQDKIQYMAGYFSPSLMENCTHLVTDSVKSEKYIKAAEAGVKLLLNSWVQDVWEASHKGNIHCDDKQFEKHRCPTFHKLVVCCTGLNHAQRNTLNKLITENGGAYNEQLHVSSTDILVCSSTSSTSAKYKAAKKRNIKCVNFNWVVDSVKNGYAMPDNLYPIKIGTSTPTKEAEDIHPNFSMISNISALPCSRSVLQDTVVNSTEVSKLTVNTPIKSSGLKRKSDSNEHNDLVDEIDVRQVKIAGPFLDGCGIYLAGFGAEQREKLCKVLNFSGATRYDDISERVTHVLVGDSFCHDLKLMMLKGMLKNNLLVNIHWLIDSIAKKHPADEQNYLVNTIISSFAEPSSPLSKKSAHMIRRNSATPAAEIQEDKFVEPDREPETDLVQQYLHRDTLGEEDTLAKLLQDADSKQNVEQQLTATITTIQSKENAKISETNGYLKNEPLHTKLQNSSSGREPSLSSAVDDSSQPSEPIYEGLTFVIVGFTEEQQEQVKLAIEAMSGKVMSISYRGIPDYAAVPVFSSELKQVATEVVTDLWITECWQENEIRPLEYFHRPISVKEGVNPLNGCVVSISSYINYERNFLRNLIIQLGGVCQEQFSRINSIETGIVASTHLVSPVPSGKKYAAALKWQLPVVTKDWLLESARTSKLPSESLYLVGGAKCPLRRESTTSEKSTADNNSVSTRSSSKSNTTNTFGNIPKSSVQVEKNVSTPSTETEHLINLFTNTPPVNTNTKLNLNNSGTFENIPKLSFQIQKNVSTPSTETEPLNNLFNTPMGNGNAKFSLNNSGHHTPENKILRNVHNNSEISSQVTPVQKIITEARKNNLLGTPQESLPIPKPWDHVDTPDTPLGAFINPNPSPNLRKQMLRFLNTLPEHRPRRDSTPLSELKRRLWDKICPPKEDESVDKPEQPDFDAEDEPSTNSSNANISNDIVDNHLQKLQDMLTSSGGKDLNSKSKRQSTLPAVAVEVKDSQPNTVGWDDCLDCNEVQVQKPHKKSLSVFMFSGIEQETRELLIQRLESVGGIISNLSNFDPSCTHLICSKPMRNEKILACMGSGKWILHYSYVDKCFEEGKLVDEEPYEYGNPKSKNNVHMQANKENETRMLAMHYWRKEVSKRGYGPFHDMRAIVVAQKRESIVRVIEAGGGMTVDARPPYSESVHATHCLLDLKFVRDISDYITLAMQGIYCINALYINEYLQRTANDVRDYIVPSLASYYNFE